MGSSWSTAMRISLMDGCCCWGWGTWCSMMGWATIISMCSMGCESPMSFEWWWPIGMGMWMGPPGMGIIMGMPWWGGGGGGICLNTQKILFWRELIVWSLPFLGASALAGDDHFLTGQVLQPRWGGQVKTEGQTDLPGSVVDQLLGAPLLNNAVHVSSLVAVHQRLKTPHNLLANWSRSF